MPDLNKRYHVLGHPDIEERDDNRDLKPEDQRPEPKVVYTTDDKDEANTICRVGFHQESEDSPVIPVVGWRDSHKKPEVGESAPPLKKSDF